MTESKWDAAIATMTTRIDSTAAAVTSGFPNYSDVETGLWTTSPDGGWTGGFWTGMLWLSYYRTGNDRYRVWAEQSCQKLRSRALSDTVFRGFLFYYGAAIGQILVRNRIGTSVALEGAVGLANLYNPTARAIPLGRGAEEAERVGSGEANIDGVPGGSLLIWASNHGGDQSLRQMAVENAVRHIEFCLRDDASVCQSATFNVTNGQMGERYTHKGFSDSSTWTRAQAWGMLGWAMVGRLERNRPEILQAGFDAADWWLAHAPADRVAYWDFDAPQEPETLRDTSGTAIAAAALLKLSEVAPTSSQRDGYRSAAEAMTAALIDRHLTPVNATDERPQGILADGCYNHRIGLATAHELIWGDYYLYETLHVLAGHLASDQI